MSNNKDFFSIGQVSKILGVSIETLRRWDKSGKLPADRTIGDQRRYDSKRIHERAKDDMLGGAKVWTARIEATEPSEVFYCPTRDVFESRIRELESGLMHLPAFKDDFSIISSSAGEIGHNSFDHNLGNWVDVPGVYFGYDLKKRMLVLADRGQGILKTLQRVRPQLVTHEDALKVAFTEVLTGRAPELRGNGLKYVRRNVEAGYFSLSFQTGDAELVLEAGEQSFDKQSIKKTKEKIIGCLALLKF